MCCCAIGCQHSTLNRLFGSWFGCVFLVWRHHLRIIGVHFYTFFSTIFLFLTFLNIHIYFIILKTYDQQFTLTTKKSLHIIFKAGRPPCRPTNSVKALKATSAFGLGRRRYSSPQRCYLHHLRTLFKWMQNNWNAPSVFTFGPTLGVTHLTA